MLCVVDIRTRGSDVPNPCVSFAYFGFSRKVMDAIQKQGFEKPTAVQAQAVPCAMSGRDVIGIAKTGKLLVVHDYGKFVITVNGVACFRSDCLSCVVCIRAWLSYSRANSCALLERVCKSRR